MSYWKCIKTLTMEGDIERGPYQAFTEGRIYQGQPGATPGGEWAIAFTNDMGDSDHLMTSKWLHKHFIPVEDGAEIAEIEADRESERQELWQPGDEPYEPDYWGAHYE